MSDPTASPKPPPPPPPPPTTGAERLGAGPAGGPLSDAAATLPPPTPPIDAETTEATVSTADQPSNESPHESGSTMAPAAGTPVDPTTADPPTVDSAPDEPTPGDDKPVLGPGKMRAPWRVVLALAWGVGILALSSVWQVSVQIGHNTWWLGPAGEPHNLAIQLLPFFGPVIVLFLIIINVRGLSWWASLFALGEIAIGAIDLSVYRNLGLLEITIGSLLLVISVASTAGRIREPISTTALND